MITFLLYASAAMLLLSAILSAAFWFYLIRPMVRTIDEEDRLPDRSKTADR